MDIRKILDNVPDYAEFMTVDQLNASTRHLAERYPGRVTVFEAGVSRKGDPILCIKIGESTQNALCFACPHPNEPIGAMTLEYLSWALAENEDFLRQTGLTWYLIKCIDPDGTRLNEGWFKGPFTIFNYARHFFRPVGYEQVEWTFPIDYHDLQFDAPMPETQALIRLIDRTQPVFIYSLHNAGFGGAFWYISKDMPGIYDRLRASAKRNGVPLHLGEPEMPYVEVFSEAVYKMVGSRDQYDYMVRVTGKPPRPKHPYGGSSNDYAAERLKNYVLLLTELPYFIDSHIANMQPAGMTRREAVLRNVEITRAHMSRLSGYRTRVQRFISADNPFMKLVDMMLDDYGEFAEVKRQWAKESPELEAEATVAAVFDNTCIVNFYNALNIGLMARSCEYELAADTALSPEARCEAAAVRNEALACLTDMCDEMERTFDYSVIPIANLVRIQLESCFAVAGEQTGRG